MAHPQTPTGTARQQLIAGAADMMRRRGLNATSIREVAKHARAPLGSTYHYFPGGKQQLATEAVQFAGNAVSRMLDKSLQTGPVAGLRGFLEIWRKVLIDSDFRAGCPVLAVTVEDPGDLDQPGALQAAAEVMSRWQQQLTESLRQHGAEPTAATQLATLIVAASEGAVALCRARRDTQPLDHISIQLETLVSTCIGTAPTTACEE